ncbi:hypothetical protein RN001_015703 [Aquatica leii]|uniref:Uncharacterized protein n=1 Tax=Aquatica leii TaxID=1421715 RepID=A0AAN7PMC1_9COLE|nr:hypothetical protein RN001_015703 [Aquatica leii]
MSEETCKEAVNATKSQVDSSLWHELRYLRIAASKTYDVTHCNTTKGALVESILEASKLKDTDTMARKKRCCGVLSSSSIRFGFHSATVQSSCYRPKHLNNLKEMFLRLRKRNLQLTSKKYSRAKPLYKNLSINPHPSKVIYKHYRAVRAC